MTASNTFTPTGNPRRRRSSGRTPREYLLHRMAQDRREKPMASGRENLRKWLNSSTVENRMSMRRRWFDSGPAVSDTMRGGPMIDPGESA